MSSFYLRIKRLMDRFQTDGAVQVSVDQLAVLLKVACQDDKELLGDLARAVLRHEDQFLAAAANRANLPSDGEEVLRKSLPSASSLNLLVRRTFFNPGARNHSHVPLSRSLIEELAGRAVRTHPAQLGVLPVEVLSELDLSTEQFTRLLQRAQTVDQRQRLMQAAARSDQIQRR